MRRLLCMTLIALLLLTGSIAVAEPLRATNRSDLRYPEVDIAAFERYELFEDELLPAKLLTFVDAEGVTQYRILAEYDILDDDGNIVDTVAGLFRAELQDAVIREEGKPDYLVTVCAEAGVVDDTELFAELDKTPGPTEEPVTTPDVTKAPVTQKPKDTPKATDKPTQKPSDKPKETSKPTSKPTSNPTAAPTQVPATPAPTDNPGGHWEYENVWVVDVEEQSHTEAVCNVCGKRFDSTSENEFWADQSKHMDEDPPRSGWHLETIIDVEEQGHWEERKVWVPDP